MLKKILSIGVAILSSFAANAVQADESGVYLGLSGGIAYSDAATQAADTMYTSTTKKDAASFGSKVYGGYSWGKWAVEAGYYDLGKYTVAGMSGVPSEDQFGLTAVTISAVRNFQLSKQWSLVGKLGVASVANKYHCVQACGGFFVDQTANSTVPILGFGGKWSPFPNVSFRADWDAMGGISSKFGLNEKKVIAGLVSMGVEFHF